jgi:predicted transcriptional regulator
MSDLQNLGPGTVLNVRVGEDWRQSAMRAQAVMRALDQGTSPEPHFTVGFADIGQMLAVFTPKRWELVAALRAAGPLTVAALARHLGRDYKNVHTDVAQLIEWMAVDRLDDGRVHVPWAEIVVDMKLPQQLAA